MNERIRELAEQAGLWRQHYDIGEESPSNLEEFAELIVRECIMVCWPGGESDVLYEQANAIDKAFIDGQDACVERLKQHFGVEE
jgi:hypothetical protein